MGYFAGALLAVLLVFPAYLPAVQSDTSEPPKKGISEWKTGLEKILGELEARINEEPVSRGHGIKKAARQWDEFEQGVESSLQELKEVTGEIVRKTNGQEGTEGLEDEFFRMDVDRGDILRKMVTVRAAKEEYFRRWAEVNEAKKNQDRNEEELKELRRLRDEAEGVGLGEHDELRVLLGGLSEKVQSVLESVSRMETLERTQGDETRAAAEAEKAFKNMMDAMPVDKRNQLNREFGKLEELIKKSKDGNLDSKQREAVAGQMESIFSNLSKEAKGNSAALVHIASLRDSYRTASGTQRGSGSAGALWNGRVKPFRNRDSAAKENEGDKAKKEDKKKEEGPFYAGSVKTAAAEALLKLPYVPEKSSLHAWARRQVHLAQAEQAALNMGWKVEKTSVEDRFGRKGPGFQQMKDGLLITMTDENGKSLGTRFDGGDGYVMETFGNGRYMKVQDTTRKMVEQSIGGKRFYFQKENLDGTAEVQFRGQKFEVAKGQDLMVKADDNGFVRSLVIMDKPKEEGKEGEPRVMVEEDGTIKDFLEGGKGVVIEKPGKDPKLVMSPPFFKNERDYTNFSDAVRKGEDVSQYIGNLSETPLSEQERKNLEQFLIHPHYPPGMQNALLGARGWQTHSMQMEKGQLVMDVSSPDGGQYRYIVDLDADSKGYNGMHVVNLKDKDEIHFYKYDFEKGERIGYKRDPKAFRNGEIKFVYQERDQLGSDKDRWHPMHVESNWEPPTVESIQIGGLMDTVFSPFQTAFYGAVGGLQKIDITKDALDRKVSSFYTHGQMAIGGELGKFSGGVTPENALKVYKELMSGDRLTQAEKAQLRDYLIYSGADEEDPKIVGVIAQRKKRYGAVLYERAFNPDMEKISETEIAIAAARLFGLGNAPGQWMHEAAVDYRAGNYGAAAGGLAVAGFIKGGEMFAEGAMLGATARVLGLASAAGSLKMPPKDAARVARSIAAKQGQIARGLPAQFTKDELRVLERAEAIGKLGNRVDNTDDFMDLAEAVSNPDALQGADPLGLAAQVVIGKAARRTVRGVNNAVGGFFDARAEGGRTNGGSTDVTTPAPTVAQASNVDAKDTAADVAAPKRNHADIEQFQAEYAKADEFLKRLEARGNDITPEDLAEASNRITRAGATFGRNMEFQGNEQINNQYHNAITRLEILRHRMEPVWRKNEAAAKDRAPQENAQIGAAPDGKKAISLYKKFMADSPTGELSVMEEHYIYEAYLEENGLSRSPETDKSFKSFLDSLPKVQQSSLAAARAEAARLRGELAKTNERVKLLEKASKNSGSPEARKAYQEMLEERGLTESDLSFEDFQAQVPALLASYQRSAKNAEETAWKAEKKQFVESGSQLALYHESLDHFKENPLTREAIEAQMNDAMKQVKNNEKRRSEVIVGAPEHGSGQKQVGGSCMFHASYEKFKVHADAAGIKGYDEYFEVMRHFFDPDGLERNTLGITDGLAPAETMRFLKEGLGLEVSLYTPDNVEDFHRRTAGKLTLGSIVTGPDGRHAIAWDGAIKTKDGWQEYFRDSNEGGNGKVSYSWEELRTLGFRAFTVERIDFAKTRENLRRLKEDYDRTNAARNVSLNRPNPVLAQ